MAKSKELTPDQWDQIEIGDQVKHHKWGVGTVLFRSGNGDFAKAIVVFPEEGQKKLMLKFAKLEKVGSTSLKSVEKLRAGIEKASKPTRAKAKTTKKAAPKPAPVVKEEDEDDVLLGDEETEVAGFNDEEAEFAGPDTKNGKDDEES